MKNIRFIITVAAMAMIPAAASASVELIDEFAGSHISPDGRFIVSCMQGAVSIKDTQSGDEWNYEPDMSDVYMYNAGLGNCFSQEGTMVGSTKTSLDACWWKDGAWYDLPVPNPQFMNMSNAITPDGSLIAGCIGGGAFSIDEEKIMLLPAVWIRNAQGGYDGPVELPHPDKDFSGRTPQYITAVYVSDDGKTVAGQIRDYSGMMPQPIIYQLEDNGEWSYTLLASDLINPSHLEFPAWPGDAPVEPMIQDYMTEAEIAAFEKALQEWQDAGDEEAPVPQYEDFATDEEKAQYEDALMIFRRDFLKWNRSFNDFMKVFNQCLDNGTSFEFNNVALSPDGLKYLTTATYRIPEEDDSDGMGGEEQTFYHYQEPMVFDLADGAVETYSTDLKLGMLASAIGEDYTVMATSDPYAYPESFLFLKGEKKATSLIDYITSVSQEDGDWMLENMTHPVDVYNPEDENYDLVDMVITGVGTMSPDMKNFLTSAYMFWTPLGGLYCSYLIQPYNAGVEENFGDNGFDVRVAYGRLMIAGGKASVEVFDLAGNVLLNTEAESELTLALPAGIYIIRATDREGNVRTLKTTL